MGVYNANGTPSYLRLDSNFTVTHTGTSNHENTIITGIIKTKDSQLHALLSAYKYNLGFTLAGGWINLNNHLGHYITNLNGNINSSFDIGVKRIAILSQQQASPNFWPNKYFSSALVTVKNYGLDTVKRFNLNLFLASGGDKYCMFGLNQNYSNTIAPGDPVIISTGTFVSFIYSEIPPATFTVCIFSSIPNGEIDNNFSNDEACTIVNNLFFSVAENNQSNAIVLSPIPAQEKISVSGAKEIVGMDVVNQMGQVILSQHGNTSEVQVLDVSALQAGIYFVAIKNREATVFKKFVKE